jgi:hypothetical protein
MVLYLGHTQVSIITTAGKVQCRHVCPAPVLLTGGGGLVPLSSAICCRPCLPSELPSYWQSKSLGASPDGQLHSSRVSNAGSNGSTKAVTKVNPEEKLLLSTQQKPVTGTQAREQKPAAADTASGIRPLGNSSDAPKPATTASAGAAAAGDQGLTVSAADRAGASDGITPVAVVSVGCHPSSGRGYQALQCEAGGASFITGVRILLPCMYVRISGSEPLHLVTGLMDQMMGSHCALRAQLLTITPQKADHMPTPLPSQQE